MDVNVFVPEIGIDNVEVVEILVKEGDTIKKEDSLIAVEGHKSVLEIPSPVSGIIKTICIKVGDTLSVNKLILVIDDRCQQDVLKKNDIKNICINTVSDLNACRHDKIHNINSNLNVDYIHASPYVRRIARILNIDLSHIVGTGVKGRITKHDINNYVKINSHIDVKNSNQNIMVQENNLKNIDNLSHVKMLTKIQQISGKNLLNNWKNIPHVTQFDEADITDLENFRQLYNSSILQDEMFKKISLLSFLVKSVVLTLLEYPRFNSILDSHGKHITLKKDINIGIAVDTKNGLLVPVLKNLKYKNIRDISSDIFKIVKKAKSNQLKISEMSGGGFTISSLGGIGGTNFTPIINSPEVCILGISKAAIKPIWNKKKFLPRLILPFSLSYDHRVIDGADGVRFTTFLSSLLTDIRRLAI